MTNDLKIDEVTEEDIGKICWFWDYEDIMQLDILEKIYQNRFDKYGSTNIGIFQHCRRLTKEEIEKYC